MEFLKVKSMYPEKKGFFLDRNIGDNYIFIQFLTPVIAKFDYETVSVKAGGCVFYEINGFQRFYSPDCDLLHNWFHADESCGELMKKYGLECNRVYYPFESEEITKIIIEIELEQLKHDKFYKDVLNADAEKLFAKISRSASCKETKDTIDAHRKDEFIAIRSEIHMNYNRDWTVKKMAELANISPSRFFCLYKKIFGVSPLKDLCITRLQRAEISLVQNDYSVERTAELMGYKNQYHFIRQFKKKTGTTPGKYKKAKSAQR